MRQCSSGESHSWRSRDTGTSWPPAAFARQTWKPCSANNCQSDRHPGIGAAGAHRKSRRSRRWPNNEKPLRAKLPIRSFFELPREERLGSGDDIRDVRVNPVGCVLLRFSALFRFRATRGFLASPIGELSLPLPFGNRWSSVTSHCLSPALQPVGWSGRVSSESSGCSSARLSPCGPASRAASKKFEVRAHRSQ